eukprot:CAMPEP_0117564000 /NCGR_PEP_ID=MMETSP0784-20121206/55798_1 /TAXON_ID=39447 /ORGANISM="" /LENGTH=714 /DNA_ID=CAMNT_0005361691 /DNA_START=42 /DNA_END=2186 /DNA_ORIENTATION=+
MAPADARGYALLPQDDFSRAGGPLLAMPTEVPRRRSALAHILGEAKSDDDDDEDNEIEATEAKTVKYDGARRYVHAVEPWVIHPFNRYVQRWYQGLCVLLAMDVVYLPWETAFGAYMPQRAIFCVNMCCTVVFIADIVLQFFLQIPSHCGDYWVYNHKAIVRSYLRGHFAVDVISVLPFAELHVVINAVGQGFSTGYLFHVLRFTKLFRMFRLRRIWQRRIYDTTLTQMQRSMSYSFIVILVTLHVMGCVWATLGNYQRGDTWMEELYNLKDSRLHGSAGLFHNAVDSSLVTYITSVYFALYTLTGIGYGDIGPSNAAEFIVLIAIMLVGSFIWATIIGEIVSVLRNANVGEAAHHQTMDLLIALSKEYSFDHDLFARLQAYFKQSRAVVRNNFVRDKIIAGMSSQLALQLVEVLHNKWVEKVWWLKDVNRTPFIVHLTVAFEPMLYVPRELIRTTDRLHVIQRGLCVHGSQVLSRDQCFGVDMLLAQEYLRVRLTTAAISYLHVIYLTREALQETLENFPREKALVKRAYRTLCLFRGVMWKAKQLRQQMQKSKGTGDSSSSEPSSKDDVATSPMERPLDALESRAKEKDIVLAVANATRRLAHLEEDLGQRMEAVEEQVRNAINVISDFLKREKSGTKAENAELVVAAFCGGVTPQGNCTARRLAHLEEDLGQRMEAVEEQVRNAINVISDFLKREKSGTKAENAELVVAAF